MNWEIYYVDRLFRRTDSVKILKKKNAECTYHIISFSFFFGFSFFILLYSNVTVYSLKETNV